MKQILLWLWCLPQNLIGLLVMLFTRAERADGHYVYKLKSGSACLGEFVFLTEESANDPNMLSHEMGHREQSRMLGWLYLPVVGLPSIIWAGCFRQYRVKYGIGYYEFYTEKWANRLGGVK